MLKLMKSIGFGASLFAFFMVAPAAAQPKDIALTPGKTWEHDWTEMEFPTTIGTFERTRLSAFEDRQTNIAANYYEDATDTYLTIYAYRPGNPVAPIWFDRALVAIGVRSAETYGKVDLDDLKIGTFVPSGGTVESGQYAVTKVDGRFRSTAAAIYQAGEWLIKLRISSQRLNVDEMETLTKTALSGLPAMSNVSSAPAYFVDQCKGSAPSGSGKEIGRRSEEMMMVQILMSGLVTAESMGVAETQYCREGGRNPQFNTFRPENRDSGFIVAIGDAGSSIEVLSFDMLESSELVPEDLYAVRSASGTEVRLHTPFTGMPNLEQVAKVYQQAPIASSTRPLGTDEKAETNIFMAPSSE